MSIWVTVLICLLVAVTCTAEGTIECKQRSKNDRTYVESFYCEEGCCGNELTYAFCCEELNPDKMYTQYDIKNSLSPIHYFLIILAGMVLVAGLVGAIFCIKRWAENDNRARRLVYP